jgi:DNA-binding SARP family transcriptional activator
MIRLKTFGSIELRDAQGVPLAGNISRAKRLALLAFLGVLPAGRFHRRDTLMAMFWPDADAERARHALRQALYVLRQSLGPDALLSRGEEELGIASGRVWVDARAFEELLAEGKDEAALELYGGEFLPGFHVTDGSPDLDEWLERERVRYRTLAAEAAWRVARGAARRGEPGLASRWSRWAAALTPLDEPAQRQLIEFLVSLGDRIGALIVYQQLADRLEKELSTTPTRATRTLAENLRLRVSGPAPGDSPSRPVLVPGPGDPGQRAVAGRSTPESLPPKRMPRRTGALVGLAAVGLLLAIAAIRRWSGPVREPLMAVGVIEVIGPADTLLPPAALASLLATSVARLPGRRVLSGERVQEVAAQLRAATGAEPTLSQAARQAGAELLVEGTLSGAGPGDSVRLALRVVDLASGALVRTTEAEASDPFDLVDRATARLARQFGVPPPSTGIAAVTTGSPEAYGLYEEGLRRYYQGDLDESFGLFRAALGRDSAFAMAAFYAWRVALTEQDTSTPGLARLSLRASEHAPTLDRLWIRSRLLQGANSPAWQVLAESLASLNPANLDGIMLAGDARVGAGDFLGGIPFYRRVVTEDSLSMGRRSGRCAACEAREAITFAYEWADSLPAAEREAREWLRQQPGSTRPSSILWEILRRENRLAAAQSYGDSIGVALADPSDAATRRAQLAFTRWDLPAADRLLADLVTSGGKGFRDQSIVLLATSLRAQGRQGAALRLVTEGRLPDGRVIQGRYDRYGLVPHRAMALMESGRGREAAALFDSVAAHPPPEPGHAARHRTWALAHVATFLAAEGDTGRLAGIADSMAQISRGSSYLRDQRLPFYVRGLLIEARGDTAAARALFRRSVLSFTEGYAQIGYRLAQCDLALRDPGDAIGVIEAIFRGPYDSGNLYLNRTVALALLARAFDAAGMPDSARSAYQAVDRALAAPEAPFLAYRAAARQWLAAHPGSGHGKALRNTGRGPRRPVHVLSASSR